QLSFVVVRLGRDIITENGRRDEPLVVERGFFDDVVVLVLRVRVGFPVAGGRRSHQRPGGRTAAGGVARGTPSGRVARATTDSGRAASPGGASSPGGTSTSTSSSSACLAGAAEELAGRGRTGTGQGRTTNPGTHRTRGAEPVTAVVLQARIRRAGQVGLPRHLRGAAAPTTGRAARTAGRAVPAGCAVAAGHRVPTRDARGGERAAGHPAAGRRGRRRLSRARGGRHLRQRLAALRVARRAVAVAGQGRLRRLALGLDLLGLFVVVAFIAARPTDPLEEVLRLL